MPPPSTPHHLGRWLGMDACLVTLPRDANGGIHHSDFGILHPQRERHSPNLCGWGGICELVDLPADHLAFLSRRQKVAVLDGSVVERK